MRVIYVAGPYRSSHGVWGIQQNIKAAARVARELWLMGFAPICPHTNTGLMDGPDIPDRTFLDGDLEQMRRCDLVVVLPGWQLSVGTQGEIAEAERIGMTVYYWPSDAEKLKWLAKSPELGSGFFSRCASALARMKATYNRQSPKLPFTEGA